MDKIKKTLQLFKDSWKGFSKKEKYQLIAVFALVLALPTILGGVYTVKLLGSRAYTVTPPVTPKPTIKPTPTPLPSSKPGCGIVCPSAGCSAGLICYQPPMPTCSPNVVNCVQAIPAKICRNPACTTKTNCVCATPTPKPTVKPTSTPTVRPTPTPTRTPTPTIKPTPKPGCGNICRSSTDCPTGLICYQPPMSTCPPGVINCVQVIPAKICRNSACPVDTDCVCGTPTPTVRPTPRPTVRPTPTPTPRPCRLMVFGICLIW